MRILMFGWEFPPNITGGLGTACYGIAKGFRSIPGIELVFVVPKAFGNEDSEGFKLISACDVELSDQSLKLLRRKGKSFLGKQELISSYITPELYRKLLLKGKIASKRPGVGESGNRISLTGRYGAELLDEIDKYTVLASEIAVGEKHDIIHAHDWLTFRAGIKARKISGKPLIVHVHATEFDRSGEHCNKMVYDIEREGMEAADAVITVSNYTRNIVINKYGIHSDKVFTVYNAVNPPPSADTSGLLVRDIPYKIVTFLGRITWQKGPEYFISAAYKVLQRMSDVRFVMAGGGDMLEKMIKYVATLGISDRFHFAGFLKGEDVHRMYMLSDLYVMPSVSEPFGISPLEAIQSGVPVIISRQSGVAEVLKHAIKIDFWDIDGMADAIYAVLQYKAIGRFLGKRGREEAANMKWTETADKIKNIYSRLLTRHASKRIA